MSGLFSGKSRDLTWHRFCRSRHTLPTRVRDYSRWHRGRPKYAVWALGVDAPEVLRRFDSARAYLSKFLLTPYRRQPHITVFVCGFLTHASEYADDYTFDQRMRHLRDLTEAQIAPFELHIRGISSFAAAPFLEVGDPAGGIQKLRRVLEETHSEIRMEPYTPHLTLGLYADCFEARILAEKMASFQDDHPLPLPVNRLCLITYSPSEIAGPLTVDDRVDFMPRSYPLGRKGLP